MLELSPRKLRALAAGLAVVLPLSLAACGGSEQPASEAAPQGDCPTEKVNVVVSVSQWGNIVSQLGGACANVTTVLASSSVDPHDYEPAPSDAVAFEGAQLVVLNGGHYDEWAAKLAATSAPDAPVVSAVELVGQDGHGTDEHGTDEHGAEEHGAEEHGAEDHGAEDHGAEEHEHGDAANPHVWYAPATVTALAEAVTAVLSKLSSAAAGYFAERRTEFTNSMKPYDEAIAAIKAGAAGKSYAASESGFDDMATAVGLANRTPAGYQVAAANESDPSPADLDAFLRLLSDRGVDVLIYNTQTEGSVPEEIRAAAERGGIPVVEVTEALPSEANSFQDWQVAQLNSLAEALGVRT